jgi:uncharacterized protein (TIGR02594 family)
MTPVRGPEWFLRAQSHIGVIEIPGPRHNPTIVAWRKRLNSWMLNDEDPWCGDFVAAMLQEAGQPIVGNFFRARAWETYGANLRPDRLSPGAILVFWRGSPTASTGHVGFYFGEDAAAYHVLGGNQGGRDAQGRPHTGGVNVTRIAKNRLTASRWPRGEPVIFGPRRLQPNGALSVNEA